MDAVARDAVGDSTTAITAEFVNLVAATTSATLSPSPTRALKAGVTAAFTSFAKSRALPNTALSANPTAVHAELPTGTDYTWAFIHAHEEHPSSPTYRYAYIFWIVMAVITVTYAASHHLRLSGGVIGAYFNRWGMRRHTVRYGRGRSFILPSNSYLLTMGMVMVTVLMLATVGPDHLSDSEGTWGGYKRAYDDMMDEIYKTELIRPKHHDHIDKALWTAGNRFGFMAFACMPLIVGMALKSGPFGFLTPRWFTALHWDKVGTFHRAGGWFVWWLVTIHVILWTTQLFKMHYDGRPMWVCMLIATRFRSAITAYFFMTAAMVLSIRWVRDRVYEIFYLSHVLFIGICFIFAIVHHHVVGFWLGACLILWFGDRVVRWSRGAYLNGVFGTSKTIVSNPFHDKYEAESNTPIIDIPPGFAQAQLLPSKTVRLSIRTHRPMKWKAGQSLLLRLPELSKFQTHPFSISNNDPNEIVLLIKARKGLTLDLYNLVLERTRKTVTSRADKRRSFLPKSKPVYVKATVDGPMGSAGRVPWTEFSNVLIVCGGSGVTFGLAVCDYLSTVMSSPNYHGATQRVRFVWIVREYAEITWAASALCRFRAALSHAQLEINIYVTNGEKSAKVDRQRSSRPESIEDGSEDEDLKFIKYEKPLPVPPAPASASSISVYSTHNPNEIDPETGLTNNEDDIRGLTNFTGEEDNKDVKDKRLSRIFQQEGKLRRKFSQRSGHLNRNPSSVSHASSLGFSFSSHGNPISHYADSLYIPSDPLPAMPADAARRVSAIKMQDREAKDVAANHDAAYVDAASLAEGPVANPEPEPEPEPEPMLDEAPLYPPRPLTDLERTSMATTTTLYNPSSNRGSDGAPSPTTSRVDHPYYKAFTSRTQDMVLLENTPDAKDGGACLTCGHCEGDSLWIDEGDYTAAQIMSENARSGRPPLQSILKEEMTAAHGQTIIATCGPVGLNTALRNLVSSSIDTARIRSGDPSGYVTMYSEDFEM